MKKIYILLAAVLLMFMAGCGSGDDSKAPPSTAKAITAFKITSPVNATGVITEATHTIAITVPHNTNVTDMVATFTITGASVKVNSTVQESGLTKNDFTNSTTNPVIYTVTAADASTQDYQVTVTVSPRSGSLDPAFYTSGMVTTTIGSGDSQAFALGIQSSDGKIVVAGYSYNGNNYDFALARYNTDGNLDDTFDADGKVITPIGSSDDAVNALGIQPDGKIVVAGYSNNGNNYDFALARYNTDGSLDDTFDADGKVITPIGSGNSRAFALGIQTDGKIVVAGISHNGSNYDLTLVRYNTAGSLDDTFDADGKVITPTGNTWYDDYSLCIQSDGKIVVAGSSSNGSDYDFTLVRYNTDGSLDDTFDADGKVTTPVGSGYDYAHTIGIQSDGKIVVAGSSAIGSDYDFALVRYNSNGSLDTNFGAGGKVTTPVGSGWDVAYTLGIQSDGKIVVAGSSSIGSFYEFPPDFALVRYNTDGSLDDRTSTDLTLTDQFGIGGKVTTPIGNGWDVAYALGIQTSDGSIVAAGYSYNDNNNDDFALVRYLASE